MKNLLILLSIATLSLGAHAEQSQPIISGNTPGNISVGETLDTSGDEQNEHCKQLRQQMDELEGKPQRRWALSERIKQECQPPLN